MWFGHHWVYVGVWRVWYGVYDVYVWCMLGRCRAERVRRCCSPGGRRDVASRLGRHYVTAAVAAAERRAVVSLVESRDPAAPPPPILPKVGLVGATGGRRADSAKSGLSWSEAVTRPPELCHTVPTDRPTGRPDGHSPPARSSHTLNTTDGECAIEHTPYAQRCIVLLGNRVSRSSRCL